MQNPQGPNAEYFPSLGNGYRYLNTVQGRNSLRTALINWYLAAQRLTTAQPNIPPNVWLQLQTPPQGNAPGAILYNCGGINPNGGGDFGVDFVDPDLYQWFLGNHTIAVPGQGNIILNISHDSTLVAVYNPQMATLPPPPNAPPPKHYQQEYHVITCIVSTIQYVHGHPFYSLWDMNVRSQNGQNIVQLTGGMPYNIILNFHLYVDAPQETQQQRAPGQFTLADFMPPAKQ